MRKLWNRPDQAVWSLVTKDSGGNFNMNICTYVTAISMEPKVMLVAVYRGTKSRANLVVGERLRLQLLTEVQAPLVRLLGRQSGHAIDKMGRLKKRDMITHADDWPYLNASAGYLDLTLTSLVETGLDHDLALGMVTQNRNLTEGPILTTTYLKDHAYIR